MSKTPEYIDEIIALGGYNPNQPRDPKGSPTGGQFASAGGQAGDLFGEKARPASDVYENHQNSPVSQKDMDIASGMMDSAILTAKSSGRNASALEAKAKEVLSAKTYRDHERAYREFAVLAGWVR